MSNTLNNSDNLNTSDEHVKPVDTLDIDAKLWELVLYTGTLDLSRERLTSEARQLINRLVLAGKIEELSNIQLEHGNYVTQIYVNGQAMSVIDRINSLRGEMG